MFRPVEIDTKISLAADRPRGASSAAFDPKNGLFLIIKA